MSETASHVIIRGHLFTYAEKQPFSPSGESILGALEYDETRDMVKCHECGMWYAGLGGHIVVHGLRRAAYNRRHGLQSRSALSGMRRRAKCRAVAVASHKAGLLSVPTATVRKQASRKGSAYGPHAVEIHNDANRCRAQLLFRLQMLAADLGHTPTVKQLEDAGLGRQTLGFRFGSAAKAMTAAGLQVNSGYNQSPLPLSFPTKAEIRRRWEERMPWPENYSAVSVDDALASKA